MGSELGAEALLELGLAGVMTQRAGDGAEAGHPIDGSVRDVGVAEEGQEMMGAEAVKGEIPKEDGILTRRGEPLDPRRRLPRGVCLQHIQ